MRGAAAPTRSAVVAEPGLIVTASSAAGGMRLSLRIARMAPTMSITGRISRSASGSRHVRLALGKGAIMMDSPRCGSRCQISSEMNGMNGCRSRSVVSSACTSVSWVTARAIGSSV